MSLTLRLFASLAFVSFAWGKIDYLGVAIPGIDFGCIIDGHCDLGKVEFPLTEMGGGDGEGQMKHWVDNFDMNTFRLPVPWQYLVNNQLGAEMHAQNFEDYDKLMQVCLDTGSYCMIDIHNFARWDDAVIGQGGPSDEDFVDIWRQLAEKYADNDKIMFGIMNEPHDLDIALWAKTCQKVVTAIRKAGATKQIILLPGTNFASAASFVETGSAKLLGDISNPDGSKDGLILDLHQYLDHNNSGQNMECTTDNVEGFKTIVKWLRDNKRLGIVSETGASLDQTCVTHFCSQNKYISENTDVLIGFVGWGAGSFDHDYVMTLTPFGQAGDYTDNELMSKCIIEPFVKDAAPKPTVSKEKPTSTEIKEPSTSTKIEEPSSSTEIEESSSSSKIEESSTSTKTKESSTSTATSAESSETTVTPTESDQTTVETTSESAPQTSEDAAAQTSEGAASDEGDDEDASTNLKAVSGSLLVVVLTSAIVGLLSL